MNFPRELVEATRHQSMVPLLGAGVSGPSGVPIWNELIARIIDDIEDPQLRIQASGMLAEGRLTTLSAPILHSVATVAAEHRRFQLLRDIYDGPFQPNKYHFAVAQLDPGTIITTNYDRLIEIAWQRLGQPIHVIWRDDQLPLYDEKRAVQIVKMHGSVDDPDMVLSASDYRSFADRRPLIYQFISTIFVTRTVLFIGCSLSDPNILLMLERVGNAAKAGGRPHFAVMHEPRPEDISRLSRYGIEVIALTGADRTAALLRWLNELRTQAGSTGESNLQRAQMFNRAMQDELRAGYPGDIVRMRASFGLISNPRPSVAATGRIYESADQDAEEIVLGEKTRAFLAKNPRNVIRQIVHIDPYASMDKGYSSRAVRLRIEAMLGFLDDFPGQTDLAHSSIPIETNQLIVGEREVISAYKYRTVGFTNATSSTNRWVVRREAETFDRDFNAIRRRNLEMAHRLGLDTDDRGWPDVLTRSICEQAIAALSRNDDELVLGDVGGSPRLIHRSLAQANKVRQRVVHVHVVGLQSDRQVLLQERSIRKSQYGGMIDVSVAGHQHTADGRREAAREAAEELGVWLDLEDLIEAGTKEQVADGETELVSIFVVILEDLEGLVREGPKSPEVDRLLSVPLDELLDDGVTIGTTTERFGELKILARRTLRESDLVPGLTTELRLVRKLLSALGS